MRNTVRSLAVGAVLAPLALGTAVSTAAAATTTPAPRAAGVTYNCDGDQTLTLSPKITDAPQKNVTGTVTYTLGDDADGLLGLLGSADCRSTDANQTADEFPGSTATLTFTATVSCNGASNITFNGGTITWDNGDTSTVGAGSAALTEVDHGDGLSEQTAPITSGPFAGQSIDIQNQESTGVPNACETNGVGQTSGTASIEIK